MSKPNDTGGRAVPQSFEAALSELQQIVGELEDGSVGLEESLVRFERGMQLLRHCHRVLESAEQRIEQLTGFDADGNPLTAPFDASATIDQRGESAGRRTSRASDTPPPPTEQADDDPPEPRLF